MGNLNCNPVNSSIGCADCRQSSNVPVVFPDWKGPTALFTTTIEYTPPNTSGIIPYTSWAGATYIFNSISTPGENPIVATQFEVALSVPQTVDITDGEIARYLVLNNGAPTVNSVKLTVKDSANLCSFINFTPVQGL